MMPTHIAVVADLTTGKPWISNDDGETWTELSSFPPKWYMGVGYDPTTQTYWFSDFYNGIYKSTDLVNLIPVFTDIGIRNMNYLACYGGKISVATEIATSHGVTSDNYLYSDDNGDTFSLIHTATGPLGEGSNTHGCCYDFGYEGAGRIITSGGIVPDSGIITIGYIGFPTSTNNIFNTLTNSANRGVAVIDDKLYYCMEGKGITHSERNGWGFYLNQKTTTTKKVRQAAKTNSGQILVSCSNERIAYFDPVAHTFSDTSSPIKNWRMVAYVEPTPSLSLYVPHSGSWTKTNELHQGGGSWRKDTSLYVPHGGAWTEAAG